MIGFTKLVRLATVIVTSAALGACGSSSKSPVAPSSGAPVANTAPTAPTSSGATIDGTVMGLSGSQRLGMRALAAGPSVTVAGTNVSSPVDGSGRFLLQGVPPGDIQLQISGTGVSAMLTLTGVSDHEQIHLTIQVSGSTATADDSDRETTDNRAEVEGKITAIAGNVLTVAGKQVTVPTGTPIHHGGTAAALSDLHVGDRVHVHGTKSATGVTATDIEWQTSNPGNPGSPTEPPGDDHGNDPGDTHAGQIELSGSVSGRTGACPALAFTVGTATVVTDAKTQFEDTTCSTLANGDKVEVKGTKQSNGSVLASSVDKKGK